MIICTDCDVRISISVVRCRTKKRCTTRERGVVGGVNEGESKRTCSVLCSKCARCVRVVLAMTIKINVIVTMT